MRFLTTSDRWGHDPRFGSQLRGSDAKSEPARPRFALAPMNAKAAVI